MSLIWYNIDMITKCLQCGKEFSVWSSYIKRGGGIYCSRKCRALAQRRRVRKVCEYCGSEYIVQYNRKDSKYCSHKCFSDARIGTSLFPNGKPPVSGETKNKISEIQKGKHRSPNTEFKKGQMAGEKNINWKGGVIPENMKIRKSVESRLWREAVFARDNWTCQKCEIKGDKLHPHHIQNFAQYPELRFAIDNGITFCEKHHRKFHKKYGMKNNTKEQTNEYLVLSG